MDFMTLWTFKLRASHDVVQFEIFHEQLPLPVPCYDLLPVIELTLGPREVRLRVLPTSLS